MASRYLVSVNSSKKLATPRLAPKTAAPKTARTQKPMSGAGKFTKVKSPSRVLLYVHIIIDIMWYLVGGSQLHHRVNLDTRFLDTRQ